jgi:hypothetical protein
VRRPELLLADSDDLALGVVVSLPGFPRRALVCRVHELDRRPELLDHFVPLVTADHPFGFRDHVPRHYGEVTRVAPRAFVLAQRESNVLLTAAVAALADELEQLRAV